MKFWTTLKRWWDLHGTKIIGWAATFIGAIAAADPTIVTGIINAIAGERGPAIAVVVGGLLTVYRGHRNSKKNAVNPQP